jgi:pimeloyl-ACP methyl ester carboxylesterase
MVSGLERVMLVVLLAAVVGCGGTGDEEGASETTATSESPCVEAPLARAVTIDSGGGIELDAFVVGEDGDLGVVLGHQLGRDFCSWAAFATKLAERGAAALAINFVSGSPDADVEAAFGELDDRGAERIFLVGASMGGTAALAASSNVDADGVAALSAPRQFGDLDALPAVRRLDVPALFLVGGDDTEFAADAKELYRATPSRDKELIVIDGAAHGTDLLEDPKAERALLDFLADG